MVFYSFTTPLGASILLFALSLLISTINARVLDLSRGNVTAETFLANPSQQVLHRRTPGLFDFLCKEKRYYTINGDGDPHQYYAISQVPETAVGCPGSTATGKAHTRSWTYGFSLNPGVGSFDFAAFSFSVSKADTKTVTSSFKCNKNAETICALHYTAITAVKVNFWSEKSGLTCKKKSTELGPGTVYLPNADGVGSFIRAGVNLESKHALQCYGDVERTVEFLCGPKGTSEWYKTNPPGPDVPAYLANREPKDCPLPVEVYNYDEALD